MRNLARWAGVAAVGAIAWGSVGIGAAAAADIPVPESQRQAGPGYYGAPEEYYGEPAPVYRQPAPVYGYPAPPPVYGYYYGGPAVAVLPGPYYRRPYYGGPVYGVRRFAPRIARGYGPYGRPGIRGPYRR
jgi:hypothetical protein